MAQKFDMLEKDFQAWLLGKLRAIPGTIWWKINDQSTIGLPDVCGCVAGVFFALELKTKSKVTAIQAYTLKKVDRAGGQSFVVTPGNAKEILAFVVKLSHLNKSRLESAQKT